MKYLRWLEVEEFNEFMNELGYYDNMVFDMDDIDEHFQSPYNALQSAYFGDFNPNHGYFTYNGYGNLESIHERDLDYYMEDYEDDIIRMLAYNGELEDYIDLDNLDYPVANETIKKYLMEVGGEY